VKRYKDDDVIDVYQEEIKEHQSFTISDGAGLTKLATHDVELEEEEPNPSKNAFKNQIVSLKDKNV
jgi:hypothetical protein